LPRAQIGAIHADGELFADMRQKLARARDGAVAVDMESHIAGAIAAEMAALRGAALYFGFRRDGPAPGDCRLDEAGWRVAYGAVLGSILRQPGQLGHLMRSVKTFSRAYGLFGATLRQVHGRLGFDHR
jgi:hypothetical protein